jgi:hypothetical protein
MKYFGRGDRRSPIFYIPHTILHVEDRSSFLHILPGNLQSARYTYTYRRHQRYRRGTFCHNFRALEKNFFKFFF